MQCGNDGHRVDSQMPCIVELRCGGVAVQDARRRRDGVRGALLQRMGSRDGLVSLKVNLRKERMVTMRER